MAVNSAGASFIAPGTQNIWVHFRGESTPRYWGTAVTAPEFEELPKYIEISNDLAGRNEPIQLIYDGTGGLVSATVNRLDPAVTRIIRSHGHRQGGSLTGTDSYNQRGAMVLGVTDFALIYTNAFYNTTNAAVGMAAGRKYFACTVAGYKESAAGTRAMEVAVVFRAWGLWQGVGSGFRTFTEDPTEFGTLTLG